MSKEKQVLTDAERPHHPSSPSSLALREECRCYESTGGTSEKAERGTLQHTAVETGEDQDWLHDHEAIAVADCLTFCDELIANRFQGKPSHDLTEPYLPVDNREVKLIEKILKAGKKTKTPESVIRETIFKGTTAGYCDRAIISGCGTFADIIDWKFGMFEVTDAEFNIQGQSYLCGLVRMFPTLEEVTVHFIAPHRDEWSYHTFYKEDFKKLYIRVTSAAKHALVAKNKVDQGDFSDATPGTSACLFCKFNGRGCTKLDEMMITIGKKVSPLDFPEDLRPEFINDPKNAGISLKLAAVTKKWAEGLRTFMGNKAVDELDFVPDGYTLVTQQKRQVVSVRGIREKAAEFGLDEETIDSCSDIALGKLETAIKADAPRGTKVARAEEFQQALEDAEYVEKGLPFSFLKVAKGVKQKQTD